MPLLWHLQTILDIRIIARIDPNHARLEVPSRSVRQSDILCELGAAQVIHAIAFPFQSFFVSIH
jgi:hypothetical protein